MSAAIDSEGMFGLRVYLVAAIVIIWNNGTPSFFPLDMILSGCPMISELSLFFATPIKLFPSNEHLTGDNPPCYQIKKLALVGITWDVVSLLRCCPYLQVLDITNCRNVNRDVFDVLKNCCPKLWKLVVNHCVLITKKMMEKYSTSTGVKAIYCP